MIYPQTIEQKLGFDGIRRRVGELCASPMGRRYCDNMSFLNDCSEIMRLLHETAEMQQAMAETDPLVIGDIHDLTATLRGIRVDGVYLKLSDLTALRSSLGTMGEVTAFFESKRDEDGNTSYPCLDAIVTDLGSFEPIVAAIDRIVDRWGQVKDSASPKLAGIRSELASMSGRVNSLMRRVVARAVQEGILEADATPSVRDGRIVIPVAPMNKRRIPGIVHDESASGKTYYIEPAEVVEANNRIRELELDERHEIIRILMDMTSTIRPYADEIAASLDILGALDFIRAKARYAATAGGFMPRIESGECSMEWFGAFHPILSESLARHGRQLVKLDIVMTPKQRILVVSGPNAGGKSVVLKTVGTVQYMLQCGMLPTLNYNSTCGIFDDIFVDIGDDQSLEDDLSTYSSHLRNMKYFLAHGGGRTLFLIDEFGSGTEPQIGGAIAQAILTRYNEHQMWGVVTTHFRNLKELAETTQGLVNCSMLYDRHLMKPLFTLSIGSPGSSFAVEIARKTGLPDDIIADAEQLVGSDYINSDRYLLDINRDRRYWADKRASIKIKEKKLDRLLEGYQNEADDLHRQRRQILDDARKEALRIIEGSNAAIERTILDIRRTQAEKTATAEARRRLVDERRRLMDDTSDTKSHPLVERGLGSGRRSKKAKSEPRETQTVRQIAVGDRVTIGDSNAVGQVTAIDGRNVTVVFGNITTTTRIDRLKITDRKADSVVRKSASYISAATSEDQRQRQLQFSPELDVRGMRVDEALQAVMYYIDDAVRFDSRRVRILHGTGTGALRQAVRQYLAGLKTVSGCHDEDVRLGGAGITVVEF